MKRIADTTKMSHDEWLGWRRKGIGGSDVAAICGLSPFASPISVWRDKTGRGSPLEDNEQMRQGRDFEAYVCDRFEEVSGKKTRRINSILQHPEHDWMLANLDRWVVGENAGFEAKTTSLYNNDSWTDGKVPEQYQLQCHHYMAVTGADRWYIGCLVLNKAFYWTAIERDEETIATLVKLEETFWNDHVVADVMPAPDGSDDSEETIRAMYPASTSDDGLATYLDGDEWVAGMNRYYALKAMLARMGSELETIKQKIMLKMETSTKCFIRGMDTPITWKPVTTERIDTKRFKKEQPAMAAQYVNVTESRRFVIPDRD